MKQRKQDEQKEKDLRSLLQDQLNSIDESKEQLREERLNFDKKIKYAREVEHRNKELESQNYMLQMRVKQFEEEKLERENNSRSSFKLFGLR